MKLYQKIIFSPGLNRSLSIRVIVGVIVMLLFAAIHLFRFGTIYSGKVHILYYSYASNLLLPFGAYFLLSINEIKLRFLGKWYVKALIVFAFMTFSEILQIFGIYFFGVTFDLLDILMFAIGALFAVVFDKFIFDKFIPHWAYPKESK